MADRGSIVSEYIYCRECEHAVQALGWLERHPRFPIFSGQARGGCPPTLWLYTIGALQDLRACHVVRFAILDDAGAGMLVKVTPEGEVEPLEESQFAARVLR